MKKIFYMFTILAFACITMSAQTVMLSGVDTIGNGRTLTSATLKLSETTAVAIYPTLQTYVDYTSGTSNCYITLWQSLDGVRWDTVGTLTANSWNFNYDAEADGTVILSSQSWTSPIITKYLKATARGHTGTQSLKPRVLLDYVKVPLKL